MGISLAGDYMADQRRHIEVYGDRLNRPRPHLPIPHQIQLFNGFRARIVLRQSPTYQGKTLHRGRFFTPKAMRERQPIVKCPRCGKKHLRWSRTKIWEWPLRAITIRPYRCNFCSYRDYLFPFQLRLRVRLALCVPQTLVRYLRDEH